MFSIKALVTLLALGRISVSAAPAAVDSDTVVALDDTAYVWACQNTNWGQPCRLLEGLAGQCIGIPGDWDNSISAIRNQDKGRFQCVWYEHYDCQGASYSNQEDAKLNDGNGFWNDRISSWRCNRKQFRTAEAENTTEIEA
ncbi:hypothetical protein QC762_401178 [Podospora pseudocomata]|uniref:Uncharacterized protein n=1 Tax=Podospora pseudocomata TaxID=2093779 RepID=A0ABR0GEP8_9PEZI|nr:hypothetical protein QC762_401178 [Podospora pseudocomata]